MEIELIFSVLNLNGPLQVRNIIFKYDVILFLNMT